MSLRTHHVSAECFKSFSHTATGIMSKIFTPEEIAAYVAADEARRIYLPPGPPVQAYLKAAEAAKPALVETDQQPIALVEAHPAPSHPLRFEMVAVAEGGTIGDRTWQQGDHFIVDFGGHRTGFLSFHIEAAGGMPDSPVRLQLTFGEVPTDVAESLSPYTGWLSPAWLPTDVVTIDDLPQTFRTQRRHAFRYVKVEVLAASRRFGVRFIDVTAHAVTSAKTTPVALGANFAPWMHRIDEVSIATLRDCLQTTFEDGPRRDRRLWVGDLRLQALANYATYGADDVVKRCLYLFAGLPRSDGMVNACVYERPHPMYADTVCLDYAALYNVTVQEYVEATGDLATGQDLWPVVRRQVELLVEKLGEDDLFTLDGSTWCFIDWSMTLDRRAAMQGVLILALRRTLHLAAQLGREREVERFEKVVERMVAAARDRLFDRSRGVYVSGADSQVSWASQAWMVLAGVPESADQAARALRSALIDPQAVTPVTPYLYHYMVEALVQCGARDDALNLMERYWGGMVKAGADTFWEAYDPENPLGSPYGDVHVNSFCHAWSCTPCYFFRAVGLGRTGTECHRVAVSDH